MDAEIPTSPTVKEKSVRLIQITDCHLGSQSSESLLGLNTDQSLADVLKLVSDNHPSVDWLVCTGDIASAGQGSCYQRFVDIVRQQFTVPLAWLPGNHDAASIMAETPVSPLPESRLIELDNWVVVLLNSSVPGQVYGELDAGELNFLSETLKRFPDKFALVMLHHQPVPVGSAWIDAYILRNADALFNEIDNNERVKAVVWGHVHQQFEGSYQHVKLLGTPATSVQFKPGSDDFAVDTRMPGYRWFELADDGSFETGVNRVSGEHYQIDYQSGGY